VKLKDWLRWTIGLTGVKLAFRYSGCGKPLGPHPSQPPRRAILRRTTRTAQCFDTVSVKPKDRLRCTTGTQDCLEDRRAKGNKSRFFTFACNYMVLIRAWCARTRMAHSWVLTSPGRNGHLQVRKIQPLKRSDLSSAVSYLRSASQHHELVFKKNVYLCHPERSAATPFPNRGPRARSRRTPRIFLPSILHRGVLTIPRLLLGTLHSSFS